MGSATHLVLITSTCNAVRPVRALGVVHETENIEKTKKHLGLTEPLYPYT